MQSQNAKIHDQNTAGGPPTNKELVIDLESTGWKKDWDGLDMWSKRDETWTKKTLDMEVARNYGKGLQMKIITKKNLLNEIYKQEVTMFQ